MSYEIIRDKILRIGDTYLVKNSILGLKCRKETGDYNVDVLNTYTPPPHIHNWFTSSNRIMCNSKEEQTACLTVILNWLAPEPPTPSLLDI